MANDQALQMNTIWQTHRLAHACIARGGTWPALSPCEWTLLYKSVCPRRNSKGLWNERTCLHKHTECRQAEQCTAQRFLKHRVVRGRASDHRAWKTGWAKAKERRVLEGPFGRCDNRLFFFVSLWVFQFPSQGYCNRSVWQWFSFPVRKEIWKPGWGSDDFSHGQSDRETQRSHLWQSRDSPLHFIMLYYWVLSHALQVCAALY